MGLMDKLRMSNMFGGGKDRDAEWDQDDYDPETGEYIGPEDDWDEDEDAPAPAEQPVRTQKTSAPSSSVNLSGSSALEMKLITPEGFNTVTVQKIADHLIAGRTVVLNLESTNKEAARRLIDFLSGVVYSIEGDLNKVTNNTVVIVPKGVHVSGEQLQEKMTPETEEED